MRPHPASRIACLTVASGIAMAVPAIAPAQETVHHAGALAIPPVMTAEHEAIHQRLVRAITAPGRTGAAARALAEELHPHFVREEQIALPPLGLFAPLAKGDFTSEMTAVLSMTDSLRVELPRMLEQHRRIQDATARLAGAARLEPNAEATDLAMALAEHAEAEEQLFYPAAVLVGEIVRARDATHGR